MPHVFTEVNAQPVFPLVSYTASTHILERILKNPTGDSNDGGLLCQKEGELLLIKSLCVRKTTVCMESGLLVRAM